MSWGQLMALLRLGGAGSVLMAGQNMTKEKLQYLRNEE